MNPLDRPSALDRVIRFCIDNPLIVGLGLVVVIVWGVMVAPFEWNVPGLPRDPVPVDAIPDIGENQQIVFSQWAGRSPQDVEDQVTYPLTVALLGVPGVRTVRSFSFLGFSSIYVIFKEDVEFYWSRSRVLEKLASLPAGTLPEGVQPALGPDATALGQVFWYTLEGQDAEGRPTGGWDLHELRSIQDWQLRYSLLAVDGVAEVASIGGFVQEYQIDVDPDAMRAFDVSLAEVFDAVRMSNVDVGARTIEINQVEYIIRGLGFIQSIGDIERTVIKSRENVPVFIENVAKVSLGPALRRGALDRGGAEAVGGVVVVRYGENPLAVIQRVKDAIAEKIGPGLPRKTLADGTVSQVAIVPFYDRTGLIRETLGTLNTALTQEILITIIVVLILVLHLRSSALIASLLPVSVLICFIGMKQFGVDANIVALSGIAIAIGTIVDMGIVVTENILKHLDETGPGGDRREAVFQGASEVGGAVMTAVATTIVGFLPVFTMEAAEGKLFRPLAMTKTFALIGSVVVALTVIPAAAHLLLGRWRGRSPSRLRRYAPIAGNFLLAIAIALLLAGQWLPLGPDRGRANGVFVIGLIAFTLGFFRLFQAAYIPMLRWFLAHKWTFTLIPGALILFGAIGWLGFDGVFGFVPRSLDRMDGRGAALRSHPLWSGAAHAFPGLGKEFMPPLDEGAFLYMPITMAHASIGKSMEFLSKQDMAIRAIPEVVSVVGKIGRADTPLDPAPISMVETVINYKPEYIVDERGRRLRFKFIEAERDFARDDAGELIPDSRGRPFRQWRPHIRDADDIWAEITRVTRLVGTTGAARLQPIAARLIMLQSGMRAPMGIKVYGPDQRTIEAFGMELERLLKRLPQIEPSAVIADRIIGKPYLEIVIDREAIARHGIHIRDVQDVIEVAVGGRTITTTVEGRERYPVRVRYMRELRDSIESLERILVAAPGGAQIPLKQLSSIEYRQGPQAIKSEDGSLVGYVLFDMRPGYAEVEVVQAAERYLISLRETGELEVPSGVSYAFAGNYENQIRSEEKLRVVLPLALLIIFFILYLQFRRVSTTVLVFSGILVAWAGGFVLLWLYGRPWFLDFDLFRTPMRDLFQVRTLNLSVAVWVGFLALFGIASDNGVILATYLNQRFQRDRPDTIDAVREATLKAALRRIRPCLMTSATTILALLPVLTSTGRGSDIMVPMAIPTFGGMIVVLVSVFVVPVYYCALEERRARRKQRGGEAA